MKKEKDERTEEDVLTYSVTNPPLEDLGPTEVVSGDSIPVVSGALVSATGSIIAGYSQLRGTFSPQQMNIAQQINFEGNARVVETGVSRLVELAEEQVTNARRESKKQTKRFYISTAITIIAVIVAIIAILQ